MSRQQAITEWRHTVEDRYTAGRPKSAALFERAQRFLPGGDTRYSSTLEPFSTYFTAGHGQELIDADGNRYLDFVNNNTALVHGHAHPAIVEAAQRQLAHGTAWAGPNPRQVDLAELLVERVPSFERVRFTNSGSEATSMMIKVARAFTGRELVMKMDAAYHGCGDLFEFGPSADDPARPEPLMAGLPANLADNLVIGHFNDVAGCLELIERHRDRLAAVILTPVMSAGLVEPAPGFLEALRAATTRHGILLCFDEVITLRLGRGGAQERFGVVPDLTAVGKIIGGGFPVGAFGGRADVMAITDPAGDMRVAHAGTFNGNPVTMAAGLASVELLTPDAFAHLERIGDALERGLRAAVAESRAPMNVARSGSLLWLDVDSTADGGGWAHVAPEIRRTLRIAYLERGVHALGINATTVMTEQQVQQGMDAVQDVLDELMRFAPASVS